MKQLLIALALALGTQFVIAEEQHEVKKVCVDVMKDGKPVLDPKTKQPKQNCKNVKQHKKLEVTK